LPSDDPSRLRHHHLVDHHHPPERRFRCVRGHPGRLSTLSRRADRLLGLPEPQCAGVRLAAWGVAAYPCLQDPGSRRGAADDHGGYRRLRPPGRTLDPVRERAGRGDRVRSPYKRISGQTRLRAARELGAERRRGSVDLDGAHPLGARPAYLTARGHHFRLGHPRRHRFAHLSPHHTA
jgi:hypothetical protein